MFWYPRTCETAASARELLYESFMVNTLELLQLLGQAWVVTLTCPNGADQWQLRIESHPAPRWNESFAYTYRGSLASVVARAYVGEPDDGEANVCGDCGEQLDWCTAGGAGGCYEGGTPPAEVSIVRVSP